MCGGKYQDNFNKINCTGCYFNLYKTHLGITLGQQEILAWLTGKETVRIDGFITKKGPMSAKLYYNRASNKIEMIFK